MFLCRLQSIFFFSRRKEIVYTARIFDICVDFGLCVCVCPLLERRLPFIFMPGACGSVWSCVYPALCYFPCVCVRPRNSTSRGFALLALAGHETRIPIHHSLQAHPQAPARPSVPRPTRGGSLAPPQAPRRARGHRHSVMDGSVGGRRPEETHMLTDAHNADTRTHTRTHKDQQGLSPTSCSEREGGGSRKEEGTPNRHN